MSAGGRLRDEKTHGDEGKVTVAGLGDWQLLAGTLHVSGLTPWSYIS